MHDVRRLTPEGPRDRLQLADDLGTGELAAGGVQRLAHAIEAGERDDATERSELPCALAGGDVHAVRVGPPTTERVGEVAAAVRAGAGAGILKSGTPTASSTPGAFTLSDDNGWDTGLLWNGGPLLLLYPCLSSS